MRLGDLDALKSEFEWLLSQVSEGSKDEMRDVIKRIDNAPTVDAVPVVHGRWIDVPWTYIGAKRYMCDQCSDDEYWKKRIVNIKENYCPNCGARMDGERKIRTENNE